MEAARLMARGDLIFKAGNEQREEKNDLDDSLTAFGLYIERPIVSAGQLTFYLWPENLQPFMFWQSMQTQWRIGQAGPEGLDYAGVWALLNHTVPFRKRKTLFCAITHLEAGALQGYAQLQAERSP